MKNNTMTLLELRDRCNELLAGTSMPTYDTGIVSIGPMPGQMQVAVTALCGELRATNAELTRLRVECVNWKYRCNSAEDQLADARAEILSLQSP